MEPSPKLLRLREVAALFQVHPKTAYSWVKTGRLPALRSPGGLIRVRAEDVRTVAEKAHFALPTDIGDRTRTVVMLETTKGSGRAFMRAAKAKGLDVHAFADPYEAALAVGHLAPAALVVDGDRLDASVPMVLRAIRRDALTKRMRIMAFSSSEDRRAELRTLGVEDVFASRDSAGLIAAFLR